MEAYAFLTDPPVDPMCMPPACYWNFSGNLVISFFSGVMSGTIRLLPD